MMASGRSIWDNRYYGPFATREAAVESATDTARKAADQGHDARVMVMTAPGLFDTLWQSEAPAKPARPPFSG